MMDREAELHGPGHALERMIFFSDAVFAIAITLLIIEVHVPHLPRHADEGAMLAALAALIPNFMGFVISFAVIGAFWAGHHRTFACARHFDPGLIVPNLALLGTIAAMPFFTALASAYPMERVPVAFYCGWLVLVALCNLWVQRIATTPPVVGSHVPAALRAAIRQRGVAVLLGAGTGFLVSLVVPVLGQIALMTIPLWRGLLARVAPPR